MVDVINIIEILKWPTVVLILGFVSVYVFRRPIEKKIAEIARAGTDGIAFERSQDMGEDTKSTHPLSFVEIMNQPISPSVFEREQTIQQQLQSYGLHSEEEKISVLERVLASTRVELEFNNISYHIFGSQMTILNLLVSTKNSVLMQQAELVFKEAQESFPDLHGGNQFSDWINYLHLNSLITINDNRINITQFGKDFLKHLVDSHMVHKRYG